MPTLVFRLNDAPADEADDVRRLLREHHIDFYETEAGRWGFSVAGIWLRDGDEEMVEPAHRLIADYEARRSARIREEYAALRAAGRAETELHRLWEQPLRVLVYLALIGLVLYLTVVPFFHLFG